MISAILCTVGNSLLSQNTPGRAPDDELTRALAARNAVAAAVALKKMPEDERRIGAELTSLYSMRSCGHTSDPVSVTLFVSDTVDGQFVGDTLRHVLDGVYARSPAVVTIPGLAGGDFKRFRHTGLRSLVSALLCAADAERGYGRMPAINATGGYKAQIAYGVVIGQALQVPVFYMFDDFTQVIEMPPLPVNLDQDLWREHASLLTRLSKNFAPIDEIDCQPIDRRIESLIDRDDGQASLNAAGYVYHEICHSREADSASNNLPAAVPATRADKKVNKGDGHHMPDGIDPFFERLLGIPYVKGIRTYKLSKVARSHLKVAPDEIDQLDGCFFGGGYSVKYRVNTTGETREQTRAVLLYVLDRIDID